MRTATDLSAPTSPQVHDDLVVMTLLQDHVPLTLICDLTDPAGPPSAEILAEEGAPVTAWWESPGGR